jgi:HK97 gp10 family phage protein
MITVNVRGTREVERILAQIAPKEAERLVKQTVSAIATDVVKDAKKEMNFSGPFSTGRMKRSVKKRQRRVRQGIIQTDIAVGQRAFYWRFYEYGDGNNPRRRMFGKAVDNTRRELAQRFETLFMQKLIRRLAKVRNGPLRGAR